MADLDLTQAEAEALIVMPIDFRVSKVTNHNSSLAA